MTLLTKASRLARHDSDPQVIETGPSSRAWPDSMTKGLGWFSIALGVTELFAAKSVAKALGMEGRESLIRAYGIREIGAGMLCLSPDQKPGMWSRVVGDGVDIATLLTAYKDGNPKKQNVAIALGAVVGVTLLDFWTAEAVTERHSRHAGHKRDYSDRSGWPKGLEASRGAAADFRKPKDMRAVPSAAEASKLTGRTSPAASIVEREVEAVG